MKLYKISIIVGNTTIERGVWADDLIVEDGVYYFRNLHSTESGMVVTGELVQAYPTQFTFITNIETKEEYDARKARS